MSFNVWLRRAESTGPALLLPRTSRWRRALGRRTPQLESLEERLLLANAVQIDVSSVLNADVVVKYNQSLGGIKPATAPVDQNLPGADWSFLTQSAANQRFLAPAGTTGLPDSGFIAADTFHPDVQLHYDLFDQRPNAPRLEHDAR